MRKSYTERLLEKATQPSGFRANGIDKQNCRLELIKAGQALAKVETIFTLPGAKAECATMFREAWPDARLIGIERHRIVARQIPAERLNIQCLNITFPRYVGRREPWQPSQPHDSSHRNLIFVPNRFDYPAYDLAFLDLNPLPTERNLGDVARFIDEHMAENAVAGVTFTVGRRGTRMHTAPEIADRIRGRCNASTSLMWSLDYDTGSHMVFLIIRKGSLLVS